MSDKKEPSATSSTEVVWGNAASMRVLQTDEVDLIITSPPYFPEEIIEFLKAPRKHQREIDKVQSKITAFALSLRPVFDEMARVIRNDGVLVIQTKNIRYGDFLLMLADTHREIALNAGFRFVSSVIWQPVPNSRRYPTSFQRSPRVGTFRVIDTEEFMVFSGGESIRRGSEIDDEVNPKDLVSPVWRLPPSGNSNSHPYGSPPVVVRRFIELYSEPGDLVVDPFSGYGTTLLEAKKLGRRAIGYELEKECVNEIESSLEKSA